MKLSNIVLVLLLITVLAAQIFRIFAATESRYAEASIVLVSSLIKKGLPLYTDWSTPPHLITPYSPLIYLIIGHLSRLFNASTPQMFIISRTVSFSATLITAVIIYWYLKKTTKSAFLGFFSIVILLLNPIVYFWSISSRPDTLAALFSLAGALLFSLGSPIWLGLLFQLVAVLSKQNYLIATISFLFFGLLSRNIFLLKNLTVIIFLPLLLVSASTFLSPNFTHLKQNIITSNSGPFSFDLSHLYPPIFYLFTILPLVSYLLLSKPQFKLSLKSNFLHLYFLISLIMATFQCIKIGSDTNYFYESVILLIIVTAQQISQIKQNQARIVSFLSLATFFIFLSAHIVPYFYYAPKVSATLQTLAKYPDPILTDYPYITVYLNRPTFLSDPYNFSLLSKSGQWDPSSLQNLIAEKYFTAVVLSQPIHRPSSWQEITSLPPPILDQIRLSYPKQFITSDNFYIYTPN